MPWRPGIILQARIASTRLPHKALMPIGGRTLLEQCLRRLLEGRAARVVLATTDRAEDDALEAIASRLGVATYRGAADDVLGRFAACATEFNLDPIVRATGDNPAVDIDASARLLAALRLTDAGYVREEGLPYGAGVEAFRGIALERAADLASDPQDREHVTTFIRQRPHLFGVLHLRAPRSLVRPDLRLTVDTGADLEYVRELYFRAGLDLPTLHDLIDAAGHAAQTEVA